MNFNKQTVTPTFAASFLFDNFIPTYHSLHVCSRQALLCARLAACHAPLVYVSNRPPPSVFVYNKQSKTGSSASAFYYEYSLVPRLSPRPDERQEATVM